LLLAMMKMQCIESMKGMQIFNSSQIYESY